MRVQSFNGGAAQLHLKSALLIYTDGEKAACTLHQVAGVDGKQRPAILAGRPVERRDIIELAKQLSGAKQSEKRSLMPANLLVSSVDLMVWHLPSARRRIFVETADKTFNADVNGREVLHPALLLLAHDTGTGRNLFVWALAADARPNEKTPLFRAPYFNLYDNGHLCEGSFKLPKMLDPTTIPGFESAFFDTAFSHTNIDQRKLTAHPHGHHALWREMSKTRLKLFPVKYLNPALDTAGKPLTVGKVIK